MEYKPIHYRQLCAIVKTILMRAPSIDDAEWKAKTHETMAKMGFAPAPADMLVRAMTQVEHAMRQTIGPRLQRPIPVPPQATVQPTLEPLSARTNRPAGWDIVVDLMAKLRGSSASGPLLPKPSGPLEILSITEEAALGEFWRQIREGADRLLLLRAFAEIAIVRPNDWDVQQIRKTAHLHMLSSANGCLVCHGGPISWHHVIQIQFGGSNYVRNRVPLCDACHAAIHPWLPQVSRRVDGYTHISGCADDLMKSVLARKNLA